MSQPTQPHQAPSSSHSSTQSPQHVQQPALGTHTPSTVAGVYSQPPVQRRRVNEDIFLNIVLYIGSLLLIGAAGLFVTSVTSSKDETAIVRVVALGLGAVLFYSAGLLTYRFVERLRIASYSFAATGLAFIPLTGIAVYVLEIWTEGRYIWFLTSHAQPRDGVPADFVYRFGLSVSNKSRLPAFCLVFRLVDRCCHRTGTDFALCAERCAEGHPRRSR